MIKVLKYSSLNSHGEPGTDIIRPREFSTKMASVKMLPEMADFWRTQTPDSDKYLYLLVNIMGASEFWGFNLNGDGFTEPALKRYHKTFMQGHNYLLHDNDDVKKSFGKIMFTAYNDDMHRVENLCRLLRSDRRTQNIESKIERDIFPEVSMGCSVPWDQCSICENIARTKAEYCDHVNNHMRQLWPPGNSDGRRVGVWNEHPTFFDNSYVEVPADDQSGVLAKVASLPHVILSVDASKDYHVKKDAAQKMSEDKAADMEKPLDPTDEMYKLTPKVEFDKDAREAATELDDSDVPLKKSMLDRLAYYEPREVVHTAALMGISIRPEEYGYLRASDEGFDEFGKSLLKHGVKRTKIHASDSIHSKLAFNGEVARILKPAVQDRSYFPSSFEKRASVENKHEKVEMPGNWTSDYASIVKEAMAVLSNDPSLFYKTAWVNVFIKTACNGTYCSDEAWEGAPRSEASIVVEMLNGAFRVEK